MDGRYPLVERKVSIGGRDWRIRCVASEDVLLEYTTDESAVEHFPYGMLLWPSAVALAGWLADNAAGLPGKRVLELGAGTGLPGLAARRLGASVVQTDYLSETLELAETNARLNDVTGIDRRILDWRRPAGLTSYDVVLAADVLYARELHDSLARVLELAVAETGCAVIADPVRPRGIEFIDRLERQGWSVDIASRRVEWEGARKEIAVSQIRRPGR